MFTQTSPFKFLDSYEKKDLGIFFGREKETRELYESLSGVKHLLIYGPSGAGKTSLIECGLRNEFSPADWYAISIRRGENIVASTFKEINLALEEKIELDPTSGLPLDEDIDLGRSIEKLFSELFQPVYLLFDQFEEMLISGTLEEKEDFFRRLNQLVRYKVPCRVLLIMREEFIGYLSEFENLFPTLFTYRFRLEKMTRSRVKQVIQSILQAPYYADYFKVESPETLADAILGKLPDDRREIDLSHVQVFLSELWDRSLDRGEIDQIPCLDLALIREEDDLETVLDSFLKKQLRDLAVDYGGDLPLEMLVIMISESFTKLQLDYNTIINSLHHRKVQFRTEQLPPLLEALEERRIIRRLKSGNSTRFEISHDTLALVVGQNLTEEMQLRAKAQDIYKVYEERQGYLSQEDLDLLRPYKQYLPYPEDLAQRINASEVYIKEQKAEQLHKAEQQIAKEKTLRKDAETNSRRARQRTRVAIAITFFALITAIAAGYFYLDSEVQREEANKQKNNAIAEKENAQQAKITSDSLRNVAELALENLKREKNAKELLRFRDLEDRSLVILEADICPPKEMLDDMKSIAGFHPDSLKLRQVIQSISNHQACR